MSERGRSTQPETGRGMFSSLLKDFGNAILSIVFKK